MNLFTLNNNDETGFVLITGLVFLLVLSILGIAALSMASVSGKMTHNLVETSHAFNAAENAMTEAEAWVKNQTQAPAAVTSCDSAPCDVWEKDIYSNFGTQSFSWWQSNAKKYSITIGFKDVPRYFIEQYSFVPYDLSVNTKSKGMGYYYYRVSSHGMGRTNASRSVIQSIYATQYN